MPSSPVAPYDALLLVSFGGPEQPADVMPFLENVTRGRGIPRERLADVAHHYDGFGGRSPINDQCRALLAALRAELDARNLGIPLYWGNRNWDPYLPSVLREADARGLRTLIAVATSAYSSYSSCRQYREDLAVATEALGGAAVDGMASMGGFFLVAVFGVLLVVAALLIRTPAQVAPELLTAAPHPAP